MPNVPAPAIRASIGMHPAVRAATFRHPHNGLTRRLAALVLALSRDFTPANEGGDFNRVLDGFVSGWPIRVRGNGGDNSAVVLTFALDLSDAASDVAVSLTSLLTLEVLALEASITRIEIVLRVRDRHLGTKHVVAADAPTHPAGAPHTRVTFVTSHHTGKPDDSQ